VANYHYNYNYNAYYLANEPIILTARNNNSQTNDKNNRVSCSCKFYNNGKTNYSYNNKNYVNNIDNLIIAARND
jgi:hypothetical protein